MQFKEQKIFIIEVVEICDDDVDVFWCAGILKIKTSNIKVKSVIVMIVKKQVFLHNSLYVSEWSLIE